MRISRAIIILLHSEVCIKYTLVTLMPSQFHFTGIKNDFKKNKFSFEVHFKNTDKINNFFRTGALISENSYIKGSFLPTV